MNKSQKSPKIYSCHKCNYNTCNFKDYNKHLNTRKHKNRTELNVLEQKNPKNPQNIFECKCGKIYTARNSYWYHKKTCSVYQGVNIMENTNNFNKLEYTQEKMNGSDKELLIKMLLKNQDVMDKMIEMMPNIGNTNNSHNNTNSHNTNNFNIQMFLNEKCKNAMNITDFIESLPVTAETFDNTIENGLTKSITTMITNGLNNMDVLERPIHCTDVNRKTLYVKDNDTWEKDNELKSLLHGIKELSIKQRTSITKWHDANEGWETDSNLQTKLSSLVFHTMEDIENNEKEVNKIIRAIGKNTYLSNETKEKYK